MSLHDFQARKGEKLYLQLERQTGETIRYIEFIGNNRGEIMKRNAKVGPGENYRKTRWRIVKRTTPVDMPDELAKIRDYYIQNGYNLLF